MLSEGSQSAHHLCFLYLFPMSLKIDLSPNIFSVVYSPQPTVMPLGLQSFLQCTHRLSDIISLILTLKSYHYIHKNSYCFEFLMTFPCLQMVLVLTIGELLTIYFRYFCFSIFSFYQHCYVLTKYIIHM